MMGKMREADKPTGGPAFWIWATERLGLPALFVATLLYLMGWKFPETMERVIERATDNLSAAIDRSAAAQIEFARQAEARAEDRTRTAVEKVIGEVQREKGK